MAVDCEIAAISMNVDTKGFLRLLILNIISELKGHWYGMVLDISSVYLTYRSHESMTA